MNKIVMGLRVKGFECAPHLLYASFFGGRRQFCLPRYTNRVYANNCLYNSNSHAFKARLQTIAKNIISAASRKQRHQTTKRKLQRENSIVDEVQKKKKKKKIIIIPRWVNFKMAAGRNWNATSAYFPPRKNDLFKRLSSGRKETPWKDFIGDGSVDGLSATN